MVMILFLEKVLLLLFGGDDNLLGLTVLSRHHIHADNVARGNVGYFGVVGHLAVNLKNISLCWCGGIQFNLNNS